MSDDRLDPLVILPRPALGGFSQQVDRKAIGTTFWSHDSLETIAEAVGYGSVPAFTRAFTRARGRTPGRYRSETRGHSGTAFRLETPAPSSLTIG